MPAHEDAGDARARFQRAEPGTRLQPLAGAVGHQVLEAVADLAGADDALLAAEQALSAVRASQSDLIASRARASEEAARHRSRLEHAARERNAAETALADLRAGADGAADAEARAAHLAAEAASVLAERAVERDAAQEAADATRRSVIELTERLQATRAELEALAEPHDAAARLAHRLSAAGWPTLLDAVSPPEPSWPATLKRFAHSSGSEK